MDGIANISINASQNHALAARSEDGAWMNTASLLLMALCAELDLVLCKCVFIPCWVQIDPRSLFFLVNMRMLEE